MSIPEKNFKKLPRDLQRAHRFPAIVLTCRAQWWASDSPTGPTSFAGSSACALLELPDWDGWDGWDGWLVLDFAGLRPHRLPKPFIGNARAAGWQDVLGAFLGLALGAFLPRPHRKPKEDMAKATAQTYYNCASNHEKYGGTLYIYILVIISFNVLLLYIYILSIYNKLCFKLCLAMSESLDSFEFLDPPSTKTAAWIAWAAIIMEEVLALHKWLTKWFGNK